MLSSASDPGLLADVRRFGRFDTNACLQCGSCTLQCDLTTATASFPRRTLRFALLGLRAPLDRTLEPWLCHYCGDCSTTCPRESEPGEGMMTLRRYLAARYDWTGLTSRIIRSAVWEIGALLAVGLAFVALVVIYHLYVVEAEFADLTDTEFAGEMGLNHMFWTIATFTNWVFGLAAFLLLTNAARMYWLTMRGGVRPRIPLHLYLTEARAFLSHAITQRRLRDCADNRSHWFLHVLLVFGCVLMFVMLLFALAWFQTDEIFPITHPQRWLGYLATVAIAIPAGAILIGRIRKRSQMHRFSGGSDWILPAMLLLTALSGIAIHILRYRGLGAAALYTYLAHMAIAVPLLLIEIPFGKWSHMIYRPLALYFQAVKDKAMQQSAAPVDAPDHAG
ncbi:MAG: 4Fe-4S dicluster domain-containing protein [Planctomycetota bacterium]